LWIATLIPAWLFFHAPVDDRKIQFSIETPDTLPPGNSGISASPAVSPDGRLVAFASPPTVGKPPVLWVRPIAALQAQPLAGTEGAAQPFWSPDSRHLGFIAERKLKKVDVTGGAPQSICDLSNMAGGTWNRTGVIVVSTDRSLSRVSDTGGPLTEIAKVDLSQGGAYFTPWFLPDGEHFLYLSWSADRRNRAIYVGSLKGGSPALVIQAESTVMYAPPGFLLYQREGALLAQAFDAKSAHVTGEPIRLADNVLFNSVGGRTALSVSDTGVLAFRTGTALASVADLAWIGRSGKPMGVAGDPGLYDQVRLSPDEKRVVMSRLDSRTRRPDLLTLDLGSHITSPLTFEGGEVNDPVWSPDGRAVAFLAQVKGKIDFYQQVLGTRGATPVFESAESPKYLDDWSPDGRFLLFHVESPSKLYAVPLSGDRMPMLLAHAQAAIDSAHFSPDGKWVSYATNESGQYETWVTSFPAFNDRRQVSSHGGGQARWRADGKELFYLTPDGQMMSVAIVADPRTGALEFKAPALLFQSPIPLPLLNYDQYDVTRDGQRFLFIQRHVDKSPTLAPITVIANWQAGLKK
jgi:Tol biopolymer transport system component